MSSTPLDHRPLDVVGLEGLAVAAGAIGIQGVFVDEVAIFVVEHRYTEAAFVELAAQPGLEALALFRLEVGVRLDVVARLQVLESTVQRLGGGRAEALGVLAVPGVVLGEVVGHAELGRNPVPFLVRLVDRGVLALLHGAQELVGDVRLHARVVVTQAGSEGPVVPADAVLGEQGVGLHRRIGKVAAAFQGIARAVRAGVQVGAGAAAHAGDLLVLEIDPVAQQVLGLADGEALVQLAVEDPQAFLVGSVAGAQDLAGDRVVELAGRLVGLRQLVVQAPLDAIGDLAVEQEMVLQAVALASQGVVALAPLVHAARQHARRDGRLALVVRAAIGALLVGIDVALVLLEDQPEAAALGVVPAQLAEQAVAVGVFRVGFAAREPGAAVAAVGFGLVALAVAIMQQAVEVVGAAATVAEVNQEWLADS